MPPTNTSTGTGKEKEPLTLEGLALKFDQLTELVRSLTIEVRDAKQQQQALGVSVLRLEAERGGDISPPAAQGGAGQQA
jgi:hypothetical protein